jgi:predicted ATP-binding protein involved in virulence
LRYELGAQRYEVARPYFWLMLKRLHLKNFTVFADANFEFSPGLNVLVGTNGTGKSHVLKVGYAVLETIELMSQEKNESFGLVWNEANFQGYLLDRLRRVFLPKNSNLGQLIRWEVPQPNTSVKTEYGSDTSYSFQFSINKAELPKPSIHLTTFDEAGRLEKIGEPIFIPAKEVLTLSWLLPASQQLRVEIEGTYLDLLNQLRLLPLRKPESVQAIQILTKVLGGEVQEEGDKYFLVDNTGRRVAISMVAEGLRKFGTLQKLLANGSLTKQTTLIWDEPESNLNPALLRQLAAILAELARQGFQIILATHSMSLLKEFHILSRQKDAQPLPIKYFGLNAQPGEATTVVATDDFKYLPDVVALDVELEQADALEDVFAKEATQSHADNH